MAKQLFGTDGIRGVAGVYPLDPPTVFAAGVALGRWCKQHGEIPEVLVGADTRESGPWIAEQLAGGLAREGVAAHYAGLITTPGVAYLTKTERFCAGAMISASHNPYQDNGIKIFGHSGYKLPDEEEHKLEETILALVAEGIDAQPAKLHVEPELDAKYLSHLAALVKQPMAGVRVVLDCGNGAASRLAPELFRRAGAQVETINANPDGRNINEGCGALHVEGLQRKVVETGAAAGFAFDGDADRCIAVSASGRVVNGDALILLCAAQMLREERLSANGQPPVVVSTVMSNLGLEKALEALGVAMVRTPVGDKYVLEEMLRRGATLGGEQSGHIIFLDHATTGDGLLTALSTLEAMRASGSSLDDLAANLSVFPQKLVNVRVKQKRPLEQLPTVVAGIRDAEQALGADGRVVVRFSGTEPLARVMVEARTNEDVDLWVNRIADAIRAELV